MTTLVELKGEETLEKGHQILWFLSFSCCDLRICVAAVRLQLLFAEQTPERI